MPSVLGTGREYHSGKQGNIVSTRDKVTVTVMQSIKKKERTVQTCGLQISLPISDYLLLICLGTC